MSKVKVVMLCGLTGSGKSTYAQKLVAQGYEKLSLDERMYETFGRAGVDYPAKNYNRREDVVNAELKHELAKLLVAGKSVVLDFGFWRKASRDIYKRIIEENGGQWRLVYFKASKEVLKQRLQARNERTDPNAVFISEEMLNRFIERFEEPDNEDAEVALQMTDSELSPYRRVDR